MFRGFDDAPGMNEWHLAGSSAVESSIFYLGVRMEHSDILR